MYATPTPKLQEQWRELFDTEPPPSKRCFLESGPAYRIQELSYGELKLGTLRRLEQLGQGLDGGKVKVRPSGTTESRSPAPGQGEASEVPEPTARRDLEDVILRNPA